SVARRSRRAIHTSPAGLAYRAATRRAGARHDIPVRPDLRFPRDPVRHARRRVDDPALHPLAGPLREAGARGRRRRARPARGAALLGPRPGAEVLLAELAGNPVGFALFFQSYSTFVGKPGLYLEDLFVEPAARGRGVGLALMSALARITVERGYGRFEWAV